MKIYSTFAMFKTKNNTYSLLVLAIFFATYLNAAICKDKGAIKSVQNCYTIVGNCSWSNTEAIAFLISITIIFHSVMTKNNENVVRVNNSNTENTFTHETGTFLTADNIERLKNLFSTPENYAKNLGALWVFRDLLYMTIDKDPNPRENQLFALWQTVNEVVGSLIRQDVHFDESGRAYYYQGTTKMFI